MPAAEHCVQGQAERPGHAPQHDARENMRCDQRIAEPARLEPVPGDESIRPEAPHVRLDCDIGAPNHSRKRPQ
jgi:hypothetical protein